MIPADLAAELATAVRALIASGDLPPAAAACPPAGTWRPAPAQSGPAQSGPAYATSLPFALARGAARPPAAIAARLAAALRPVPWIAAALPTGPGYLTITVTPAALAAVAFRTARAGPACARTDALRGHPRETPPFPDLTTSLTWQEAWQAQAAALAGALARAAGATPLPPKNPFDLQRKAPPAPAPPLTSPPALAPGPGPDASAPRGAAAPRAGVTVAAAASYLGAAAVRFWLSGIAAGRAGELGGDGPVTREMGLVFPGFAESPGMAAGLAGVRRAHDDAAATLRWAAELGMGRGGPPGAGELGAPAETALLERLSWLGERVAGAARRGEPSELPRYLELLAAAWADCRDSCPALPFRGRCAPRDAAGVSARLWLADATRAALAAGLELTGATAAW